MKVVIIGSKGFIGQHLLSHFIDIGQQGWGADVIVDYVNSDNYYLIDSSNSDFNMIFEQQKFDLCVNCSGAASVPDSIKNPLRDYYLNTVNVYKILDSIRKFQPECKFINLSSAAVYGNPQKLPIRETAIPKPLSPYGLHKLQAEELCREFYTFHNLQTCSVRIFSAYGEGLKKQLFWDLYKKAKEGKPFTLYGTGKESRDFIHISDLAKAIVLVSEKSNFESEVINLANGIEVFIEDAVSVFLSQFAEKIKYTFSGDSREGDPRNWGADISKLSSYGYKTSVDLHTGLKKYYEWINAEIFN